MEYNFYSPIGICNIVIVRVCRTHPDNLYGKALERAMAEYTPSPKEPVCELTPLTYLIY